MADTAALLHFARQKLSEGQPSIALQAVVVALRAQGGETAVMEALHRARTLYHNAIDNSPETDELSDLLARCALAEARQGTCTATETGQHSLVEPGVRIAGELGGETGRGFSREVESNGTLRHVPFESGITLIPQLASQSCDMEMEDVRTFDAGDNLRDTREGREGREGSLVPILAESGRMQLMADAAADGSSFTCPYCLGLVKLQRRDEHFQYWCSKVG